jgi:outer membrane lipase/esterase
MSGRAPADALYVVEIGGNDIRAALVAGPGVLGLALTRSPRTSKAVRGRARHFLVWSAPTLDVPQRSRLNTFVAPGIAAGATAPARATTRIFQGVLQGLGAALPGITIVPFDAFGLLADVQANPRRFGLINATTACIEPNVPQFGFPSSPPFRCAQQDRFFFWDGIHPTRAGHAIIAIEVGKTLIGAVLHDL